MDHKEILRHYGIRAQKSLGQNFLVNDDILETIADSVEITGKDILEIGPGYGALTEKILARKPRSLTLVELDKKMVYILQSRIREGDIIIPEETIFTIIEGDVLKYTPGESSEISQKRSNLNEKGSHSSPGEGLSKGIVQNKYGEGEAEFGIQRTSFSEISPYSVIANIPYYITSPILFRFLHELENKPEEMVILMQKEVGDKICRKKGYNNSYLSLALEFSCETIEEVCLVPKENFIPSPKIDSSVLSFKRKKEYDTLRAKQFLKITSAGFTSPRKKLLSNLANTLHISKEVLHESFEGLELLETARAEELGIGKWKELIEKIT
ncbi:MAG: rRNA adenine dimethyltransferase family protein [Candidatus Gracilibacteria bacterium]|nr:rRNA adenine dimethyltransferase family protein [Candidatus Gracilibacteria bacterium]